jgi:hypothetical protein
MNDTEKTKNSKWKMDKSCKVLRKLLKCNLIMIIISLFILDNPQVEFAVDGRRGG